MFFTPLHPQSQVCLPFFLPILRRSFFSNPTPNRYPMTSKMIAGRRPSMMVVNSERRDGNSHHREAPRPKFEIFSPQTPRVILWWVSIPQFQDELDFLLLSDGLHNQKGSECLMIPTSISMWCWMTSKPLRITEDGDRFRI